MAKIVRSVLALTLALAVAACAAPPPPAPLQAPPPPPKHKLDAKTSARDRPHLLGASRPAGERPGAVPVVKI